MTDTSLHSEVLEHMDGGVLTVGEDGRVLTFNPSAARLLGLSPDDVLDQPFAATFMAEDGLDDFSQAIMDAIYEAGTLHQRIVRVERPSEASAEPDVLSLSVTASYLTTPETGERRGLIAIFTDVSEVMALRDAEHALAEEAQAQSSKLQEAYGEAATANQALAAATKRERFGILAVVVVFLGVGFYAWMDSGMADEPSAPRAPTTASTPEAAEERTVPVTRQRLTQTIALTGALAAIREEEVTSPAQGVVAESNFEYGQQVEAGQILVELDASRIETQFRSAQAAHIKALARYRQFENWDSNIEVVRSRRALNRLRRDLETQNNQAEQAELLFEKGVIPARERDSANQRLANLQADYAIANQDLENILARGKSDDFEVARLELENAESALRVLEETLEKATIRSPVSGVILPPADSRAKRLVKGSSVNPGDLLVTIGELTGLSITSQVDEVDVVKVEMGQRVVVKGDAFPEIQLDGVIDHVSSQARVGQMGLGSAAPMFDVRARVEELSPEELEQLRLGMSADLDVAVYDEPNALMLPLEAVEVGSSGDFVYVKDPETDAIERVRIRTGLTTFNAVQVLDGLEEGDQVLLSPR